MASDTESVAVEYFPVLMVIRHRKTQNTREIEVPYGDSFILDKHEDVDWQATQGLLWRKAELLRVELAEVREKLKVAQDGYDSNTQLAAEGNIVILRQEKELREARKTLAAVRGYCERGRALADDDIAKEVLAILEVKGE